MVTVHVVAMHLRCCASGGMLCEAKPIHALLYIVAQVLIIHDTIPSLVSAGQPFPQNDGMNVKSSEYISDSSLYACTLPPDPYRTSHDRVCMQSGYMYRCAFTCSQTRTHTRTHTQTYTCTSVSFTYHLD